MFGGLFKPKWQHKDARTRLQAIPELAGDSAELIQLAQNDPNTGVRLEAVAYLTDFPSLLALGKRADAMGDRARQRLLTLVPAHRAHDAALVEVFDWLATDPGLLNTLARDSKRQPALRKLAVGRISDQQMLARIAHEETSRDIQFLAASQLNDLDALCQLEKTHGKNNKRLRQLLKERMAKEQASQQHLDALTALCVDLDNLGRSGQWPQDKTRHKVLLQSWKQQRAQAAIPDALAKQFQDAEKEFLCRLEKHEAELAAQAPRLAVFETCLQEAAELHTLLLEQPEQLTLAAIDQQLEQLQERWVAAERLPDAQQTTLNQRWVAQFVDLTDTRDAMSADLGALGQLQACYQQAESLRASDKPLQAKRVTDLQSDWTKIKRPLQLRPAVAELETGFHQVINSLNVRLEKQAAQRAEVLAGLQADLAQMEADLAAEQYGEAIDLHQRLNQALKERSDLPAREVAEIKRRLQVAAPLVLEFKDWRRWGTDQAREHLIETAEQLERDESLDPQARAQQIKALREEWRKLAQMEPGQQRKQWKTFDTKVTAAYEVSKQYFAEQASERDASLHQREQICAALETLQTETDWNDVDWRALQASINEQRKVWKQCGTVGHKEWKAINQRFNAAMDALDAHAAAERTRNFAEREALVVAAKALLELEDVPAAIEQAKALQSQWHITAASRPKEEQKLWKQFRTPIDELFVRLQAVRKTQRSETDEKIAQKEALCVQVEAIAGLSGDDFTQAVHELESLQQAFNALRDVPKAVVQKLEERFQRARTQVQTLQAQVRHQQQLAALDAQATASSARKAETLAADAPGTQADGEKRCLQLEILLDLPTPAEFQRARMEYQIAQMSEAMLSRADHQDSHAQGLRLLEQWYQLGAMPAAALASQQARIDAVRVALVQA